MALLHAIYTIHSCLDFRTKRNWWGVKDECDIFRHASQLSVQGRYFFLPFHFVRPSEYIPSHHFNASEMSKRANPPGGEAGALIKKSKPEDSRTSQIAISRSNDDKGLIRSITRTRYGSL